MSTIAPKINNIVMISVSILIVAVIMPIALANIITGGLTMTDASVDTSVVTMFTTLLPIVAIVGILIYYIPRR